MGEHQQDKKQTGAEERSQAIEKKRKRSRQIGAVLLVFGGLSSISATTVSQQSGNVAETVGVYSVPLLCWLFGFYYFFKGGGKVA